VLLKPAYSPSRIPAPIGWQELACGDYIRTQTQLLINDYGRRLRCGTTVLLGPLSAQLNCQRFSVRQPLTISPNKGTANVRAQLEHLPLKNGSVDQIILPFVLEFGRDPHQILREVNRVLADDGYLLLTGFNPLSPALISGWNPKQKKAFPWAGRYFTALRVKDWLSLLGYEIVQHDYFIGRFLNSEDNQSHLGSEMTWTEKLCRKAPLLNASYAILARKCVYHKVSKLRAGQPSTVMQRPVVAARIESTLEQNKEVLHD